MTGYQLLPLVEIVASLALLALLLFRGKQHQARRPFSLFLVSMVAWGFFVFMMRRETDLATALIWEKLVFAATLSAAALFYTFTIELTGVRPRRWLRYIPYGLYLVSLSLIPTTLMVGGMQQMWYGKAPLVGPLFAFYVVSVYVSLVVSLVILIEHGRRSKNLDQKTRGQYVIAGLIAMFIGGVTDYLPALGISLYPLGIVGNIIFCLLATTAMLRYNLLETRVVIRRAIACSLAGVLMLGIFYGLILLLGSAFQTSVNPMTVTVIIVSILIAVIGIALFQPMVPVFQRMVDRWFLRERYDHLEALRRLPEETKDVIDLRHLGSSLVAAVAKGMQSRSAHLLLPSAKTGHFVTHSSYGKTAVGLVPLPGNSLIALALKYQNAPIDVNDIDAVPTLKGLPEAEREMLVKNHVELLLPLVTHDQLIGLALISSRLSGGRYSVEDRRLLSRICREVVVSLENAVAYESIQKEHGQLIQAMDGIIHAMCLVMETRDPYTAGHQRRVADIACAIARGMGLSEWDIKGIQIAGLLHDVGKLSVPAEILTKPGKLNTTEFNIIKSHPQVSYDILEMIEFPWPVKEAVVQHHERLDGSGYPDGILRDEITTDARILGVADVVEAISSHRPYRPALGLEFAMREIIKNRGVLYDTDAVNACLAMFEDKAEELEQLLMPMAIS
ncbi:MAG: HD domain-containing phosphohydrolase [Dehalococcoidales bacterium]